MSMIRTEPFFKQTNSNLVNIKPSISYSFTSNVSVYDYIDGVLTLLDSTDKITINDTSISVSSSEKYDNNLLLLLNSYTLEDTSKNIYKAAYEINVSLPKNNFGSFTTLNQWELGSEIGNFINNYFLSSTFSLSPLYIVLFNNSTGQYYSYSIDTNNFVFSINSLTSLDSSTQSTVANPSTSPITSLTDYGYAESDGVSYIVGGKDSDGNPVNTVYYNTGTGWVLSSVTLSVAVSNPLAIACKDVNSLVVIGGEIAGGTLTNTINTFDIEYEYSSLAGGEVFYQLSTNSAVVNTALPASKGGQAFFVDYEYSNYLIVFGLNTGTSISDTIYCTIFDNYDIQLTFYDLGVALPFTGNFVSTSIYNQGYGFFLGNISGVMTLSYLYLTTNSDGSGNLVGSIENATITGAMSSIGTNSTLKIGIGSYPDMTTEYYIEFMGEEDTTTNLYNMYVSNLTFNGTETSLFTNLQVSLDKWSKIITPVSTATVNLNWSMSIYTGIVIIYSNLETITLDISDAKNYFYIPDSTLNPFTTPPSNYYFIGSMKIENIVTDDSLSISDLDLLSNAGSSLDSKYKSNGYSFTNQDNFESVMEINGGASPTFTLKYSNPDAISVNNLQEIADPSSTISSTPEPGIKIYSYLSSLVPGMTINSINAKISSSKIPPNLSLNIVAD